MFGRANNTGHYSGDQEESEDGPDTILMDYAYMEPRPGEEAVEKEEMVETGEGPTCVEDPDIRKKGMPLVVIRSKKLKWISVSVVRKKGWTHLRCIRWQEMWEISWDTGE